jgi:hypothetical protein
MIYFNSFNSYDNNIKKIKNKVIKNDFTVGLNHIHRRIPNLSNFIFSKIWTVWIKPTDPCYYSYEINNLGKYNGIKQYKDNL